MCDKQMILVCGMPHSGTTIVRKLIGNIDEVFDHIQEIDAIMGINPDQFTNKIKDTKYKAIVVKSPFTPNNIADYKNFKIVFVIRNPYDLYGSYRLRFKSESHYTHAYASRYGIGVYVQLANLWLQIRNNPEKYPNIFPVKYEEMFENEYQKVKDMVSWLGFPWNEKIINSERVAGHQNFNENKVVPSVEDPSVLKNTGADNVPYRFWQINQPFQDMSGNSRHYIFKNTKIQLDNLPILKELDYNKYGNYNEIEKQLPN